MRANYRYCLIVLLFLYSCVETLPDEELTMKKTLYNGKEIRLDGFYIGKTPGQTMYSDYIFFYSNGVLFSFGYSNGIYDLSEMTKDINSARTNKDSWGIFQVTNDTISIQGWRLRDDVHQYILTNYHYKIINDTTLFYENVSGDTTRYHFKHVSPKPDSTNVFIK